jgi:hypothetical protein
VATEKTVGSLPPSLQPLFEHGDLWELFVSGGSCKTSKGVGIADARKDVDRLYGKGKESRVYLEKGKNDRVGSLGEHILEYPGVAFVIAQDKVAAFFIRGKPHSD